MKVILYQRRKGKVPGHSFQPPRSQVLVKRRQISVGSYFRARFPHPDQLSCLRKPGIQPNWPSVSSGCQMGETRSHRLWPGRQPLLLGHRGRYEGEVHRCLKAWTKANGGSQWGLWSPTGHNPQSVPWACQLTRWPKEPSSFSWTTPKRSPKSASYLTLHLMTTTSLTAGWTASGLVRHWQLLVGMTHCGAAQ